MAGLSRALAIPNARWIIPAAQIPMGYGFTWYQRPYTDLSDQNRLEFEVARNQLTELTESLRAETKDRPIVYMGFSQGGVLAMEMALRSPQPVNAAVNLSGALYMQEKIADELSDSARETPIYWGHGTHDGILPIGPAREQVGILTSLDIKLAFHEYPLDHSISADELEDVRSFLQSAVGS
jgi:phospholipase/carboxylesterase